MRCWGPPWSILTWGDHMLTLPSQSDCQGWVIKFTFFIQCWTKTFCAFLHNLPRHYGTILSLRPPGIKCENFYPAAGRGRSVSHAEHERFWSLAASFIAFNSRVANGAAPCREPGSLLTGLVCSLEKGTETAVEDFVNLKVETTVLRSSDQSHFLFDRNY